MNRAELNPHSEGVNVVNIESTCIHSADQGCTRNKVRQSSKNLSCNCTTFQFQEISMNNITPTSTQPVGMSIHRDFIHYVAVNQEGVKAFLKAIAVNAVGQAITLAAVGVKVKSISMPNMSGKARCRLALPKNAWVNDLTWVQNEKVSQARFLEITCWQISGAVAEHCFDAFDHYGNLGLEDIEGSYKFLSSYEASHDVQSDKVLAGCTYAVELLLSQHCEMAEAMAEKLFNQGSLCGQELNIYLSCVHKEALGKQVLAALQEPWIEEEAERVHRMFIGSC
jgi:hypothetical protein